MRLTSFTPTVTQTSPPAAGRQRGLAPRGHLLVMKARNPIEATADEPRHIFLTAGEVIARYRWGRTKGYEQLRRRDFPRPVAGRYRLDLLMAWEDEQLAEVAGVPARADGPPAKRHLGHKVST